MHQSHLQRVFWIIILTTFLSYGNLFRIAGPDAEPVPIIIFSIVTVLLSIASITVIFTYIAKRKPAQPAPLAGIIASVGLLFGILLSVGYIVNALA